MSKYVVTNGYKFLRQNKAGAYSLARDGDATVFKTFKQALNAMNSGISKQYRESFYVDKVGDTDNSSEIQKLIEADMSDFNHWLSSIGNFKKFVDTINREKHCLIVELESIEQEICDIRHYIEFGVLNAYQSWAACAMMKTALVQRRKIKDALYIVEGVIGRSRGVSEVDSVRIAINNLNTRTYTPRKLNFLFESCGTIECRISV